MLSGISISLWLARFEKKNYDSARCLTEEEFLSAPLESSSSLKLHLHFIQVFFLKKQPQHKHKVSVSSWMKTVLFLLLSLLVLKHKVAECLFIYLLPTIVCHLLFNLGNKKQRIITVI